MVGLSTPRPMASSGWENTTVNSSNVVIKHDRVPLGSRITRVVCPPESQSSATYRPQHASTSHRPPLATISPPWAVSHAKAGEPESECLRKTVPCCDPGTLIALQCIVAVWKELLEIEVKPHRLEKGTRMLGRRGQPLAQRCFPFRWMRNRIVQIEVPIQHACHPVASLGVQLQIRP